VAVGVGNDLWTYDFRRNAVTKLTTDGSAGPGLWNTDGTQLIYSRWAGARAIYRRNADGTGAPELLLEGAEQVFPASVTNDSRTLVLMRHGGSDTLTGIWTMSIDAGGSPGSIVRILRPSLGARVSPNGRWISYFIDNELYVSPFPNPTTRHRVSRDGAREAVWSRDGRELFFRSGNRMMVAGVQTGAVFSADVPRELFTGDYYLSGGPGNVYYDVSLDGTRFLMIVEPPSGPQRIEVVQGWRAFAETEKR
jgi:Tol biopolymer transport system component